MRNPLLVIGVMVYRRLRFRSAWKTAEVHTSGIIIDRPIFDNEQGVEIRNYITPKQQAIFGWWILTFPVGIAVSILSGLIIYGADCDIYRMGCGVKNTSLKWSEMTGIQRTHLIYFLTNFFVGFALHFRVLLSLPDEIKYQRLYPGDDEQTAIADLQPKRWSDS